MEEIVTILSTREWAITIWGTGFFIWMLTQSEIRKSLWNVIKILLGKNLRRFFLIIALYVAGITMIFYQFEKNLRSILETLTTKAKKYDWIITLKNNIFETPYFSDCSFLLMEKANEDRIPKEHLAKYICQFYLSRTYSDLIHDDRQINVFSKYKLEKHHIVPVGSVSKIGESTDILRKDKTNIVNSPLNYVFISDATNLEISNISLKEYEQDITASAKAALNIVNYPSVEKLNDKTTIKAWLKERYKILKGQIQNRVMNMLLS